MNLYTYPDGTRPPLTFNGLEGHAWYRIHILLGSEESGKSALLRACYEDDLAVTTCLWGYRMGDHMELALMSRPDMTQQAASDPIHHHITALTRDASLYISKLGIKGFIMRTNTRGPNFFATRFPQWSSSFINGLDVSVLEVP